MNQVQFGTDNLHQGAKVIIGQMFSRLSFLTDKRYSRADDLIVFSSRLAASTDVQLDLLWSTLNLEVTLPVVKF